LIRRAADGDPAAFSEIYERYRDRIYGFAYRMVNSQPIAEDVTQETFMVLIEHPQRYRAERASLLTYLCSIARNQILYHLRRTRHEVGDEFETSAISDNGSDRLPFGPLRRLLDEELSNEVNLAIAALPPLHREVIVLREFQELSYEEIAAVTNVEVTVVKVRLHRARQSLARRLIPYLASVGDQCHELR
jgi:RNA polymerase sigma-70 factor (ECF subfamily)